VGDFFWVLMPIKVNPSKDDPRIMALTGVCDGFFDVSSKMGKPPNIRVIFLKH